ncbi:MAG: antibiotic biosynthesis monooxygenase [bacterium]|nr:antibiotic biosynthesis monooxygenase [bacterium]
MSEIAKTPEPPYYAVIFTSHRTEGDNGYGETAENMVTLASRQPGFLGMESARERVGITVSYWSDLASITAWKQHADHLIAQQQGREVWYEEFTIRISKVEKDYRFSNTCQNVN